MRRLGESAGKTCTEFGEGSELERQIHSTALEEHAGRQSTALYQIKSDYTMLFNERK
jgi:hypothetical protein